MRFKGGIIVCLLMSSINRVKSINIFGSVCVLVNFLLMNINVLVKGGKRFGFKLVIIWLWIVRVNCIRLLNMLLMWFSVRWWLMKLNVLWWCFLVVILVYNLCIFLKVNLLSLVRWLVNLLLYCVKLLLILIVLLWLLS